MPMTSAITSLTRSKMESGNQIVGRPSREDTLEYVFDMLDQLAALLRGFDEVSIAELLEAISEARRERAMTVTKAVRAWTEQQT